MHAHLLGITNIKMESDTIAAQLHVWFSFDQEFDHSVSINFLEVLCPYMYTVVPSNEMTAKMTVINIIVYKK